jgi:hypothetical protein
LVAVVFAIVAHLALPLFHPLSQPDTAQASSALRRDRRPAREVTVRVRSTSKLSTRPASSPTDNAATADGSTDEDEDDAQSSRRERREE